MKYQLVLLLFAFVGLAVAAFAQGQTPEDVPVYRLRERTAVEFIEALPDFEAIFWATTDNQATQLIQAVETEFLMRFGDNATFAELGMAFDQLRPEVGYRNHRDRVPVIPINEWMARLIDRWFSENPTDLNSVESINRHPLRISVEPHDFDLDGETEWILDVEYVSDGDVVYSNFLVADGNLSQYNILPLPIPFTKGGQGWSNGYFDYINLGFQDITADGQMEWLFSTTEFGPGGPGYTGPIFTMYALGWRDGEIAQLYRGPGKVQNIDDDDALEFQNAVTVRDNWSCGTRTIHNWDWDGTAYIQLPDRIEQLDCSARWAEEAMWTGNFETAAEQYEAFLEQYADIWAQYDECRLQNSYDCGSTLHLQMRFYFLGRRIIAYALAGNTARVQQLLDEAAAYPDRGEFLEILIVADTTNAETLCQVAYDYFSTLYRTYPQPDPATNELLPGIVIPNVNDGWDHTIGYAVNPARSGCDIALFGSVATPTPTSTSTPYPTIPPPTPDTRSIEEQWIDWQNINAAFQAGDYETALIIVEQAVPRDNIDAARWHYWRALVYEVLGRHNDALNEYINLYLNYPGSWWSWLAGLHLERVDT